MQTKEQIYDEQIRPLVAQIARICQNNEIPALMDFETPSETDAGLVVCVATINTKTMKLTPRHLAAMGILTQQREMSDLRVL